LSSCTTKKNIIYLGNQNEKNEINLEYSDIVIQPDDILKIDIKSINPKLNSDLNINSSKSNISNTRESYLFDGYQVSPDGYVYIPLLGKISVSGLTVSELNLQISNSLKEKNLFNNSLVDIKILNKYFTVIGEVNKPGRYSFIENNLNIFEAIALGGDMTINGERNNVRIIRNYNNIDEIILVDLTKDDSSFNEFFQIYPRDIIIVNQNRSRVKNAGIIGNSGTLISLLSFLLSSIIIMRN
tara:strand:- start:363 stop:1085 length:723 start_codon:yes stop_codon:yes gene_type:complete